MSGFVIWFTGLSGSGKSTLAAMLSAKLQHQGIHTEVLDGDVVRKNLSKGLGFSKEDRDININRIGFVASLVANSGGCAITAAISPYKAVRAAQRALVSSFVEVYCDCQLDELIKRDPKGLYKKALAGEIKGFTGIDAPYEKPINPEITLNTFTETAEESLDKILNKLQELGLINTNTTTTKGLIAPHGGTLVNRESIFAIASSFTKVTLDERTACDLRMIGEGGYSPLTGFMNEKDYLKVVKEMRLENGLPWAIPIVLPVSQEQAGKIKLRSLINLIGLSGNIVGTMTVSDKFTPDKELECQEVYKTTDMEHPGVSYVMKVGDVYLGGEVNVFSIFNIDNGDFSPKETRWIFEERGWKRIVAFQTRNPMHRAHEYLTKCALEMCDGLLIHPLVGATKAGDVDADVRMSCYEALINNYYSENSVVLGMFPAAMRYAGPREAIHHAICRKNYGCSHFIVGRDHAGVGDYYGTYDAQKIFDEFSPGELGIIPLCFEHTFYSKTMKGMGSVKTAPGGSETKLFLSGTKVRKMLENGEDLPEEFTRPEVALILKDAYNSSEDKSLAWPLATKDYPIPVNNEPGTFGYQRRGYVHSGVDLYCEPDTEVLAIEDGIVVTVLDFTGSKVGTSWWNDTQAILIEGKSGVINYGEVKPLVEPGDKIKQGQVIAKVVTVMKRYKGNPMTMLHFEFYDHGVKDRLRWEKMENKPKKLLDPTDLLKKVYKNGN